MPKGYPRKHSGACSLSGGLIVARGSHEGGSYHACTSVVPPFCIHHSTFCLRLGVAWTENGRPQGICRKIRLHVNNQPTKTVNTNLGLYGAAVVRRRAPPENKRETRATQEEHKRSTRATQEEHKRATPKFLASGWPVLGLYLALGRFLYSAFCIRLGVASGCLPVGYQMASGWLRGGRNPVSSFTDG